MSNEDRDTATVEQYATGATLEDIVDSSESPGSADAVIEAGVWFAPARDLELDIDRMAAVREIDLGETREVAQALQSEGIDTDTVAVIRGPVATRSGAQATRAPG